MRDHQFRSNFRIEKKTLFWLEKRLWIAHTKGLTPVGAKRKRCSSEKAIKRAARRGWNAQRIDNLREWDQDGPARAAFMKRLVVTLYWLASGSTYRETGNQFGIKWINYEYFLIAEIKLLSNRYVRWPRFGDEMDTVKAEFKRLRGFESCLGAIDGTYIPILAPWSQVNNPAEYNTRKMFYAVQLEVVATPNLKFTHAYTGWPGSRADAHILKHSKIWRRTAEYLPAGCYLFGDSGYPLLSWLMTPFTATAIAKDATGSKGDFNFNHASTRVVVEQALGLLKSRFRILKGIDLHLDHVADVVTACVTLHNICIDVNDSWAQIERTTHPQYNQHARQHTAGDVPRGCGVGADCHRHSAHRPDPTFTKPDIPPQHRRPPAPSGASKAKGHQQGRHAKREELRRHVQCTPACKLFGGRKHQQAQGGA